MNFVIRRIDHSLFFVSFMSLVDLVDQVEFSIIYRQQNFGI